MAQVTGLRPNREYWCCEWRLGWMAMKSYFYFESEAEAKAEEMRVRARGGTARVYRRAADRDIHSGGPLARATSKLVSGTPVPTAEEVPAPVVGAVAHRKADGAAAQEAPEPTLITDDQQGSTGGIVRGLQERLGKAVASAAGRQAWPLGGGWWAMRREVFARAVEDRGDRQLLVDAGVLHRGGGSAGTVVVQRRGQMERVYKVRLSQGG